MVKISDLRAREVVNVLDGKKLGSIIDIDLDMERGKVLSFILPGRLRGWSIFSRREEIVVPWEKIVRIGRDVILVEVPIFGEVDQQPYNKKYMLDEGPY
ncbi:Sporulation protein YlmC/YmxH [Syntrophomonas zehnderi OL-4]|uniref:Sporulation protein YlmC/YmxH n=1 Tax=Syntrophomonas zehnderi OL-4 TaxID=690567 RepID=A0A0E4GBS5_9FIRM|nr:YlmC/YmxH family sporulation protein [Syntrophomonas zehnderi]CFX57003.1 Sporulation protein YlmC/YmxH [Syntrophomonas zehnderi OL-4]